MGWAGEGEELWLVFMPRNKDNCFVLKDLPIGGLVKAASIELVNFITFDMFDSPLPFWTCDKPSLFGPTIDGPTINGQQPSVHHKLNIS